MKYKLNLFTFFLIITLSNCGQQVTTTNAVIDPSIQNGDIIFHTSKSNQSKAIQEATGSKYSHMGIIYKQGEKYFVYEAIQPVTLTPLDKWMARGEGGHYVIKRLKDSKKYLTETTLLKMKAIGDKYSGKNYDNFFEWSDDRMYCSELVWKIYKEGCGIEIGKLEQLKSINLESELVRTKIKKRYGNKIPLNELVISPGAMFDSDKLTTVIENE
ncbi:MAG: YiiX family permuted papain-like enzyme [Sphingobacteriales bacterium]|jgi:uncharacterized protein YycO